MDFKIEATNCLGFPDSELSELLNDVYVGEGYTEAELAESLFDAAAIRSRGRFHHNALFTDEEEMQDFMEEHIYPFKLLLEYQFLKKEFFDSLKNFDVNWRAA